MGSAAVSAKPVPRVLPPARTQGDLGRAETKIVLLGKPLPLGPAVTASSLLPSAQVNSGALRPHRSRDGASIRTGSADPPYRSSWAFAVRQASYLGGYLVIVLGGSRRPSTADGPPTVQRSEAADRARAPIGCPCAAGPHPCDHLGVNSRQWGVSWRRLRTSDGPLVPAALGLVRHRCRTPLPLLRSLVGNVWHGLGHARSRRGRLLHGYCSNAGGCTVSIFVN